jgi:hypothetical protein
MDEERAMSPEPSGSPDPAPAVPTYGYAVPSRPAARATSLRASAGIVVAGLGTNIAMFAAELVITLLDPPLDDERVIVVAGAVLVTHVLAFLVTAAAFITWMYQARRNIDRWEIAGLGWGPGWAIGGWFIPLANLVIPKLVMDAIWSGSVLGPTDRHAFKNSTPLIRLWWLPLVIGQVASRFASDDPSAAFSVVIAALVITSAVAGILVIRRITRLQEERQQGLDRMAPAHPAYPSPTGFGG